jgi:hypothetical protein
MNKLVYYKLRKVAEDASEKKSEADTPFIKDPLTGMKIPNEQWKGTATFWDRHGSKLVGTGIGGLTTAAIAKMLGASNIAAALWALPGMGIGHVVGASVGDRARQTRAIAKANKLYKHYINSKANDRGWNLTTDKELERLATDLESKAKAYYDKYGYNDYNNLTKVLRKIK